MQSPAHGQGVCVFLRLDACMQSKWGCEMGVMHEEVVFGVTVLGMAVESAPVYLWSPARDQEGLDRKTRAAAGSC